ncbi:MAG: ABC transporter permease, partial [bacterium]
MTTYIARRILYMIPTVIMISIVAFAIIQLPPGDYLTTLMAQMAEEGENLQQAQLERIIDRYGLDQPVHIQYFKWIQGIITRGDFGMSFEWNVPVTRLIWSR